MCPLLRCLAAYVLTLLASSIILPLAILDRRGRLWWPVARWWGNGVTRVMGASLVHSPNDEQFADLEGAILMANHQSNLDVPVIVGLSAAPVRFITKHTLFWIPIFGVSIWAMGMIPVNRSRRDKAIASLTKAAEQVRCGKVVLVFPEGTRSYDRKLGPFKKGGFMLALQSGAPIIPVGIAGTGAVVPRGWKNITPGKVGVVVGHPIPMDGLDVSNREHLMSTVRDALDAQHRAAQALIGLKEAEE